MSNEVNLSSFPSSTSEALAMLYTQNQDLSGKSVTEIAQIYYDAYYKLNNSIHDIRINAKQSAISDIDNA